MHLPTETNRALLDVTVCAIQHRIQRLKERAKGDSTGPRSPSTPKGKRGRHSKKKDDEPATKKPKTADETGGDAAAGGDAAVAQT